MEKYLENSTKRNLEDLLNFLYTFNNDKGELYRYLVNACSTLATYFENSNKKYSYKEKRYIAAIYALNNAFKHQNTSQGYKHSNLNIIEYRTTLNFILDAPLGYVAYFKNSKSLGWLRSKNQKEAYKKYFCNKQLNIIFKEIKEFM